MNIVTKFVIVGSLVLSMIIPVALFWKKEEAIAVVQNNLIPIDDEVSSWTDPTSGCVYLYPEASKVLTIHRNRDGTMDCPDSMPDSN
jgi:hypothetical protein